MRAAPRVVTMMRAARYCGWWSRMVASGANVMSADGWGFQVALRALWLSDGQACGDKTVRYVATKQIAAGRIIMLCEPGRTRIT